MIPVADGVHIRSPSTVDDRTATNAYEESSGIIDAANVLSRGWYAFDAQVHSPSPNPAHAEKGQLLVMRVADWGSVYR